MMPNVMQPSARTRCVFALLFLLIACNRDQSHGGASASTSVIDSAGIRIVLHDTSARAQATWSVDTQPILAIGGADGTGPSEFADIWGVARTADGHIVASDAPEQELRVFDAAGRHLHTMGRKGQGPGEFRQIRGVYVYGDTVYATDNRRGTAVFTLDGKLLRQTPYPSLDEYHAVDPWGVLADGSTIEGAAGRTTKEMMQQIGRRIEMRGLFRISPDGRTASLLATIPAFEYFRAEGDPPGGDYAIFAPTAAVTVFADRVCYGRGNTYELRCITPDGALQQIIRRDVAQMPVPESTREAYRTAIRGLKPTRGHEPIPQQQLDMIASRTHFAESYPLFGTIVGGKDGALWVSEYRHEGDMPGPRPLPADSSRWNVFAADGTWIGAIALPPRFLLKEAGADYVLGVSRDADGVQGVAMYRLRRH